MNGPVFKDRSTGMECEVVVEAWIDGQRWAAGFALRRGDRRHALESWLSKIHTVVLRKFPGHVFTVTRGGQLYCHLGGPS